jgi:hypothetical protein
VRRERGGDITEKPQKLGSRVKKASHGERQKIINGMSETAVVPDTCKTIVLYDKLGAEVGRAPVTLKPGELNVFTW